MPARGQLGTSLRVFVDNGDITIVENASVASMETGERLRVNLTDGRSLKVDLLVPATGFRPNLAVLSELRLDLDQIVEAPVPWGRSLTPNAIAAARSPRMENASWHTQNPASTLLA